MKNKTFNKNLIIKKKIEEEPQKQYNDEIKLEDLPKELDIEVNKHNVKSINLEIKVGNKDLDFTFKNATLIKDKNSNINDGDITIKAYKKGESKSINLILNLNKITAGNKKFIFYLNVNNKNLLDKTLVLNVNLKEHEKVKELRETFKLSEEEYDSNRLLKVLENYNFDINKAFSSLFQ